MLLAIETSCDETAVALFSLEQARAGSFSGSDSLLAEELFSQVDLHKAYGGVVPEIAAREHSVRLPLLIESVLAKANAAIADIEGVAVTVGPGLKGCLLVGLCWAKGFCLGSGAFLLPVHHIEGHVLSGEFQLGRPYQYPCIALVVSGGHTELILIKSFRDYQILARTRDDAAGEAFDKCATLLGLGYPGGPALSRIAASGDRSRFPFSVSAREDGSIFSFSGLKTAAARAIAQMKNPNLSELDQRDLAASIEQGIVENLVYKAVEVCRSVRPKEFIVTGGVAANSWLREKLTERLAPLGVPVVAPAPRLCTDNAVMIGFAGLRTIQHHPEEYRNWKPDARLLGPGTSVSIAPQARFPIEQLAPS